MSRQLSGHRGHGEDGVIRGLLGGSRGPNPGGPVGWTWQCQEFLGPELQLPALFHSSPTLQPEMLLKVMS